MNGGVRAASIALVTVLMTLLWWVPPSLGDGRSRSIGYPWQGRLANAVKVTENPNARYTTEYAPGGRFFGTTELVNLVERAAARVARRLPGGKLSVGELSRANGGDIEGHSSHENGRDVDLAFYMLGGGGRPFAPMSFAEFDAHGRGVAPNRGLVFDDARNWELVARLVSDPDARVQFIFVSREIRERVLAEGRRRDGPASVLERASVVMSQPAEGHPHRNHFHVRIYCPPASRPACKDRAPFHAWYPGDPPGVAPLPFAQ